VDEKYGGFFRRVSLPMTLGEQTGVRRYLENTGLRRSHRC